MQKSNCSLEDAATQNHTNRLSSDWQTCKLGNIADVQTGPFGSQLHASDYSEDGVPVVMPRDIVAESIAETNIARVPLGIAAQLSRHRLRRGDIVLGRRGEMGRAALIREREDGWLCGTGCLRIRPTNNTVPAILFRLLSNADSVQWLTQNAAGQTMLNLSASIVSQLPIQVPSPNEQARIAEILDAADATIRTTENLIAAKTNYKAALAEQLLTGKRRFPEFAGQEWCEVKLGDFFREKSQRAPVDIDPVVLSCSKIYGILPQSERFSRQLASRDLTRYKYVGPGDLVFDPMLLWDASLAFSNLNGVVSPAYCTLSFTAKEADSRFFHYLFYTHEMRHTYKRISKGTNVRRKKVLASDFLNVKVSVPNAKEQRRIADVLSLLDGEIDLLKRQLVAQKAQKDGLMQVLLTGQVRVKEFRT